MLAFDRPAYIVLPPPISTNALFRNVEKVGRVKSTPYKEWLAVVDQYLRAQPHLPRFLQPVGITLYTGEKDVGNMDSDNVAKAYIDTLKRAGIIKDDSRKYVRSSRAIWVQGMRSCVVEIKPDPPAPSLQAILQRVPKGLHGLLR
jgi:Holliday junction resolvase RusA-like endonuclease